MASETAVIYCQHHTEGIVKHSSKDRWHKLLEDAHTYAHTHTYTHSLTHIPTL
ncbi:hypothetical protein I79_004141 [Cricetulus griseus]|uniref:Uncharacterized protein n=1 Tax=Cricetulus griseus TaxID=10029 RepID=G3H1V5_CRIGR|nr:hypothetical protein I79_004141 [Cricetulus griseus]